METRRHRKPATVDEYLARLSADKRAALERLRQDIHVVVPRAEECISYQIPAFRVDGRVLVWFGAGANHCAFYPGGVVQTMADELKNYRISKGTVRFQPDGPLPAALVRKLVHARMAALHARPGRTAARSADTRRRPSTQSRPRRNT